MSDPVTCLFRVKLQLASANYMHKHPVVRDGHDLLYLNVAANDADAAVAAAHAYVRRNGPGDGSRKDEAECTRLVSVRLVASVDLFATGAVTCSALGTSSGHVDAG